MIDKVIAHIDAHKESYVKRLNDFLRIASISTDPSRNHDTRRAGEWVHRLFTDCGIKSELVETKGHPCVVADSGPGMNDGPTVMIYGHFDVQPVGDESLWHSPPFEPTVRNGSVFARGSADDKGQVLTHLLAAEAWMAVAGMLPGRVKFLVEGEEEIGSPNLGELVRKHRDRLSCDYVAISDTAKMDGQTPAITYGTKGLIYKEIVVTGPKQDLHSGSFGGTLVNPGNALAKIIASLRDEYNRVNIPGFYDDVRELSDDEKKKMRSLKFDEEAYREGMGTSVLDGEKGYTTLERRWSRPTLDVNGLFGGFMGKGASTIIPAKVGAKVSMRLVPDQNPDKIAASFDETVRRLAPKGVKIEIHNHSHCGPYVSNLNSPGMEAAKKAVASGFGKEPVFIREGGSLPILPMFKEVLGADSLMMGFCWPDCNAHGPNEFFALDDLHNGARTAAYFMDYLSKAARR